MLDSIPYPGFVKLFPDEGFALSRRFYQWDEHRYRSDRPVGVQNGFIDKYLNAKFGCRKKLVERSVNITNMSAKASVPYVTYQKIRKYNVYFGEVKLDVYVYGEDRIVVKNSEAVSWTEVRHSGLSAE